MNSKRTTRSVLSVVFGGVFAACMLASVGANADAHRSSVAFHGDGFAVSVGNGFRGNNFNRRGLSNHRFRGNNFGFRGNSRFDSRFDSRFNTRSRLGSRSDFHRGSSFYGGRSSYGGRSALGNGYNRGTSCSPVRKNGLWRGSRAIVGGTQCFGANGGAYIVPDSRYLIRYY